MIKTERGHEILKYYSIRNGNIKLKTIEETPTRESICWDVNLSDYNYKEKINRHNWFCQGSLKRLIGKKIFPGIEIFRGKKINVLVLNLKETIRKEKIQAELLLQNRFKKLGQAFINASSRKDAKGEVATKKCRSWNSFWATRLLLLKDLSSLGTKQKLSVISPCGININFSLN